MNRHDAIQWIKDNLPDYAATHDLEHSLLVGFVMDISPQDDEGAAAVSRAAEILRKEG